MEASMHAGDKVVFHAGASGIGTAGIQLAKGFGCESFVSAGTKEKIDFCINLGVSNGELRAKDIFSKICFLLFFVLDRVIIKMTSLWWEI